MIDGTLLLVATWSFLWAIILLMQGETAWFWRLLLLAVACGVEIEARTEA